jgi:hypothetical protein
LFLDCLTVQTEWYSLFLDCLTVQTEWYSLFLDCLAVQTEWYSLFLDFLTVQTEWYSLFLDSELLKNLILKIKETETKSDIKDQRNKCRIDTLNSFIHDRSLSLLVTGASIK